MRKTLLAIVALTLAIPFSGCLVTGQVTLTEPIDIGASTNNVISRYFLDLNGNSDYDDNKDDIKSVDALSIVAKIKNNTGSSLKAQLWMTPDNTNLTTVGAIQNQAVIVFESPAIPPNATTTINWPQGFNYVQNENVVIDEILGDGDMTIYGIANVTPFDVDIKGHVAVTLTVGK